MRRRLALGRAQWVGLPILLAIPLLALFGVFGEREGDSTVRSAELEMRVRWPARTRHEMIHDIDVVVRNVSARTIDTLTVTFDTTYLAAFSAVSVTPGAAHAWEVELEGVRPGEARHVVVAVDAHRFGRRTGSVIATGGGSDTARVVIDTFIFP
jgi:hypothetical protein